MQKKTRKSIAALVENTKKRVYVYLCDEETWLKFILDAETEGYRFSDGKKLSEREPDNFYTINGDRTINFIGTIGRIAWQCRAEGILCVNYKEYIRGEDFLII